MAKLKFSYELTFPADSTTRFCRLFFAESFAPFIVPFPIPGRIRKPTLISAVKEILPSNNVRPPSEARTKPASYQQSRICIRTAKEAIGCFKPCRFVFFQRNGRHGARRGGGWGSFHTPGRNRAALCFRYKALRAFTAEALAILFPGVRSQRAPAHRGVDRRRAAGGKTARPL
jgi:hypothetical protein